ncbi:MAG: hypothetical protein IPG60_01040 [Bacteroidetes bacterium]|nr:hypothetical protein [Bacteroidota bacterium]MBP7399778.1 hypothetical protein [Chitinophagales bacterium]MBK7108080.1 hypothetical protein [Bacteroidota bacterium]MBK8486486.1 hypothetical protein [Bacteroidota bacterium]MBP8754902.1 hypothetical protein [Chitinophagales bacterium]
MKLMITCFAFILGTSFTTSKLSLDDIRRNYQLAVDDKSICRSMIDQLGENTQDNVQLAYRGAFQTIWANHTYNPVSKFNTFNAGKDNIEKAVTLSPNNVEIIFIRYSIQKNIPSFLGYKSNMQSDRKFLQNNLNNISSAELKKMVVAVLNS